MSDFITDLRSDTVTQPSKGMKEAMASALLGDDVFGDDPTINLLQEKTAAYFRMESALFFPSGTMANQVAIKTHTLPGDEIICDEFTHIYRYEGGGIAATSGVSVRLLKGNRGVFTGADVLENINADDPHFPITRMVEIENTANRGGGHCWSSDEIIDVCSTSHASGLITHLDGARLWNAMVATGQEPTFFGQQFDSISVCFSKGMGAPIGSVLLGKNDFIKQARRHRKRLGGGMRQIGMLGAACIYALENNIKRLTEDHKKASEIASTLEKCNWVKEILPVETNIIYFRLESSEKANEFIGKIKDKNILATASGKGWVRFVFHLDISDLMVEKLNKELKIIAW
jgi:threonine aldolase